MSSTVPTSESQRLARSSLARPQIHCHFSQCVQADTLDKNCARHGTETRLSPLAGPITAARQQLIVPRAGAIEMYVCYIRDDNGTDVERCRISLSEKSTISLFTLDTGGRVACLTGVVQSIQFDPKRAVGMRWRVEMDLSTVASTGKRVKAGQRAQ